MKRLLHLMVLFLITQGFSQTPIYKFDFDGNTNNSGTASVTTPFNTFDTPSYTTNRDGIANKAMNMSAVQFSAAVCPSLPLGNSPRTLNVWAKFNVTITAHYIAGWGTNAANQAFGVNQNGTNAQFYNWGTANDVNVSNNHNTTSWYMYTFVYDGTSAKHYINGVLMSSVVKNINTVAPGNVNKLSIGRLSNDSSIVEGNYVIDDLSVFSVALTGPQVLSMYYSNNATAVVALPSVTGVSVLPASTTAQVNFTLNANNANTTSIVRYGLSAGSLTSQVNGSTANGNTATPATATLSGLTANTTYYYRVEATNGLGTTLGSIASFTTSSPAVLAEYDFDNSYNDENGNNPFQSNQGTAFVTDRNGNTNGALNIVGTGTFAAIQGLPSGNSPRTVALWVKMNQINQNFNFVYTYGTAANYNGVNLTSTAINHFGIPATNHLASSSNTVNTWFHLAIVFDGTNSKIYKNGVLLSTAAKNYNTIVDSTNRFKLGLSEVGDAGYFNGAVDDLKIYPHALTDAEVVALYNPTTTTNLPVISNVSVGSLIHEGANISYTVNANGAATDTFVLYGKLPAANEVVAVGTVATGTNNTACSAITQYNSTPGAAPAGTTMYYKVQATNASGTVFSPVFQYTQVTKPTYELSSATSITTNSATLNYTLNPCGANATSIVRYGTSAGNYTNTTTGFSALGFTPNTSTVVLSALSPNTTYFYIVEGTNVYGVSQSIVGNFTTQGTAPTLTNINVSAITNNSASVNFDLNTGGTSTTTTVFYGTSSSNLNLSAVGPTVTNNVATTYTVNVSALLPNTTYYYNVVANGNGQTTSATNSFTTAANPTVPTPIYNFEFNNNLQSQDGSVTLNPPIAGSYGFVSNGTIADGALQINDARSQTSLPNIPLGTSSRSVHLKLRFASGALATENFVFNWGTGVTGQAFAYHQTATTAKLLGWGGAGYDYASIPSSGANFGQWYEYVFTYNGTAMSVYRDGVLLGSTNVTLNTTGDVFRLGVSNSGIQKLQADIDYVRIYNQALNSAQVSLLYANPNLSNPDVASNAVSFVMYPNPAFDSVSIAIETPVKSVEIYTLQGQKVVSTSLSEIVISDLSSGIYLVKVEDVHGNVATQKLVKK